MLCRLGKVLWFACLTTGLLASGARALCIYGGKHFTEAKNGDGSDRGLYATTTLADEFLDSTLVVKGTVLSSRNIGLDANGTIYRIRIDRTFKGKAPAVITDYTDRDSGGPSQLIRTRSSRVRARPAGRPPPRRHRRSQ